MGVSFIDELIETRQQVSDSLDAAVKADDFDPDSKEYGELKNRAVVLDKRIEAAKDAAQLRAHADELRVAQGLTPAKATPGGTLDVGAQLIRSEHFQMWKRAGASGRAKLLEIDVRALLTTSNVPVPKDRIYAAAPAQNATLLSVLNTIQVSSGSVEVVTYPSADPVAGDVPEGTAKPEATITVAITPYTLVTQAHWVEATRQVVEDEPRLRDFIQNSLLRGVIDKAESNAAAAITAGTGYGTASAETMVQAIRIGIAQVNDAGFRPNAVLMNPMDAASLDYEVWSATNGGGSGAVWGTPVIPNGAMPAGTAYVADFSAAFHHYYRGSADLFVSDSDVATDGTSNFKRNVLTFLAEYRSVTAVVRPEAASKVTVTTPPPLTTRAAK